MLDNLRTIYPQIRNDGSRNDPEWKYGAFYLHAVFYMRLIPAPMNDSYSGSKMWMWMWMWVDGHSRHCFLRTWFQCVLCTLYLYVLCVQYICTFYVYKMSPYHPLNSKSLMNRSSISISNYYRVFNNSTGTMEKTTKISCSTHFFCGTIENNSRI